MRPWIRRSGVELKGEDYPQWIVRAQTYARTYANAVMIYKARVFGFGDESATVIRF